MHHDLSNDLDSKMIAIYRGALEELQEAYEVSPSSSLELEIERLSTILSKAVYPGLNDCEVWIHESWMELSTCRPTSMSGIRPIPWSSINDYYYHNIHPALNMVDFIKIIRTIDNEYIKAVKKIQDSAARSD